MKSLANTVLAACFGTASLVLSADNLACYSLPISSSENAIISGRIEKWYLVIDSKSEYARFVRYVNNKEDNTLFVLKKELEKYDYNFMDNTGLLEKQPVQKKFAK